MQDMTLSDLIRLDFLQPLKEQSAVLAGTDVLLLDADGVSQHSRPVPAEALEMGQLLCARCREERQAVCRQEEGSANLYAALPIVSGERYLGCWALGPFPLSDAEDTPRSKEEIERLLSFLEVLNNSIVRLAQTNLSLEGTNRELCTLAQKLDSSTQMFATFINATDAAFYVADFYTGNILMANRACSGYAGIDMDELPGVPCWTLMGKDTSSFCPDCPRDKLLDERGEPTAPYVWEQYYPKKDMWLRQTHQALRWVDGRLAHMVTYVDITAQKLVQQHLSQLAFLDAELRLPNGQKLLQDLEACGPVAEGLYLICFDILSLRKINDIYGRDMGDALLRSIKEWVLSQRYPDTELYRTGGDEFCLLHRDETLEQTLQIAKKLSLRFEDSWPLQDPTSDLQLYCNITVGIVDVGKAHHEDESPLNLAERVLTAARRQGSVAVYDEEMDQIFRNRVKMEWSLRQCVKDGMKGFDVHYQPIIDPLSGRWCCVEALCRWNSPDVGPVAPPLFIAEAEKMGLIGAIGLWVLDTAVRHCKRLGLDLLQGFMLDVNLSPAQLMDETIVDQVQEVLARYDYPATCLSLEITESMQFNFGSRYGIRVIQQLQDLGIQMALDDFGTGYASFDNLKHMPAGRLKTERVFLKNIENDPYLQFLLSSMANLAHAADMKLVAEGVETLSQLKILLQSGADYLQGYLFSKPMAVEELEQKLDRFYKPDSIFATSGANHLSLPQLLDAKKGYCLSPRVYAIFHECVKLLTDHSRTEGEIVSQVLQMLVESLDLSKAMLLRPKDGVLQPVSLWGHPSPRCTGCGRLDLNWLDKDWLHALREDGMLAITNAAAKTEGLRHFCKNARSLLFMPLWEGEALSGMLALTDCRGGRDWQPQEALLLNDISLLLGGYLREEIPSEQTAWSNLTASGAVQ